MVDGREGNLMLLVLSGTFVVLVGLDLISDYSDGGTGTHLVLEGLLFAISGTVFVRSIQQLAQARKKIEGLQNDVENLIKEKERWKGETHQLLAG
ncbi:MAG: hypothetical protein COW89_03770, partial [Nitrospinae bacterium CG22_combo_CG10-13_8_21_14_all_47_10]